MVTDTVKNHLQKFWEEQCTVFLENLASVRIRPGKRNIHDLRVAVKKMKSAVGLAVYFSDEKEKPGFDTIRQLFRSTGKYRDVEVSIFLLRKLANDEKLELPSFTRNLRAMHAITRDLAKQEAAKNHELEIQALSSWVNQQLATVQNEMLEKKTKEQVRILLGEIKNMLEQFSKRAHEIRIRLKQLYYWLKLTELNPIFNKKQMKNIDRVLTNLGSWHDYFVLHTKANKFRKEYLVKNSPEFFHTRKAEEICKLLQEKRLEDARLCLEKAGISF